MIEIEESGMQFGPFDESEIFYIESSELFKSIKNAKTVEFILRGTDRLKFVEAKSSSPQNKPDTKMNFDSYIRDISDKFLHSLNLYCSAILERHQESNDIPADFTTIDHSKIKILFLLIIKKSELDWLPPVNEALIKELSPYRSIWNLEVAVLNEEMAREHKLIR